MIVCDTNMWYTWIGGAYLIAGLVWACRIVAHLILCGADWLWYMVRRGGNEASDWSIMVGVAPHPSVGTWVFGSDIAWDVGAHVTGSHR